MELTVAVLALIATIAGIIIAYRQNIFGQKLAKRELGESAKFRVQMNRTDADQIVYVLPWNERSCMYISDFELSVSNLGIRDLVNVFVMLEIQSELYRPDVPREYGAGFRAIKLERFVDPVNGKEMTRITFKFDRIQPSVAVRVIDHVAFTHPGRLHLDKKYPTKDGSLVSVSAFLVFGYDVRITMIANDTPPFTKSLSFSTFDAADDILKNASLTEDVLLTLCETETGWEHKVPAAIFWVDNPDFEPAEIPEELRGKLARVRLTGCRIQNASYHPDLGYIPF